MPRTLQTTAILFKESGPLSSTSRKYSHSSSHSHQNRCQKPAAASFKTVKENIHPITNTLSKIFQPLSNLKSNLYRKLGLSCLFPKLLRPVQPAIESIRYSLGLGTYEERKGFIDSAPCSCNMCKNTNLENKPVTRDLGLPSIGYPTYEKVANTKDQCFQDMENVTYGSRVIVKLVDDQPCSDPKYESICEEQMNQSRVLFEEDCQTSGYRIFIHKLLFIDRIQNIMVDYTQT